MAKRKKRVNHKMSITGKIFVVFCITFLCFIFSSIILKSYNVAIHCKLLNTKDEIVEKKETIAQLQQDIITLRDQEYILNILNEEGLKYDESAIYNIGN